MNKTNQMDLNFSAEHLVLKEKILRLRLRDSRAELCAMGGLVSSDMEEIEEIMVAKKIIVGRFSEKHQGRYPVSPAMDLSLLDSSVDTDRVQQFENLDQQTISFLEILLKNLGKKQIKKETYMFPSVSWEFYYQLGEKNKSRKKPTRVALSR